jgi:protein SCO1/2
MMCPSNPHRHAFTGVLLVAVLLSACNFERTFDVRGQVVGFGDDQRTVIISHESVPGFMPAMTMPFRTTEPASLRILERGDAIRFTLAVTRDSAWIYDVARLPQGTPLHLKDEVSHARAASDATVLELGDHVPPFALMDQSGSPFSLGEYAGTAVVINFIYTRCPIPTYCPRLSARFAELQPALRRTFGDDVALLTVSFDPKHDTPEVLAAYARRYTRDTKQWRFATGTEEQVDAITGAFGVSYRPGGGEIIHNLVTAVIGPDRVLRARWRGTDWAQDEVVSAVGESLAWSPSQ